MKKKYLWILIVSGCVLTLYYPLNFASFNSVDDSNLVQEILNSNFSKEIKDIFLPSSNPYYYRPLLYSTFFVDKCIHLCEPSLMHLENVILHVLNSLIAFYISLQLLKNVQLAGIAALLFASHPINTEAVDWISARTDLLAGFFSLLGFAFLIKKKIPYIAISAASFLAGLLCKESGIGFILFAFIFVFFFYKEEFSLRQKLFFTFVFTLALACYFLMRYPELRFWNLKEKAIIPDIIPKGKVTSPISITYAIGVFFKVIGFYFKKLFVPWPLNFAITKINKTFYLLFGIFVLFLIAYSFIKERDGLSMSLIWSFCFMLVAVIVPLKRLAWTPLAERYVYISSFGMALFVGYIMLRANKLKSLRLKRIVFSAIGIYASVFAISTAHRNYIWKDNYRLYLDTVKKSPDFGPAHNELAIALLKRGRKEEAKKEFEIAAKLTKGHHMSVIAEGNVLILEQEKADPEKILSQYDKLINKSNNKNVKCTMLHNAIRYITQTLLNNKEIGEKERYMLYKKEIEYFKMLAPLENKAFCSYRIGQLYLALGDKKKAAFYFKRAYELADKDTYFKRPAYKLFKKITN